MQLASSHARRAETRRDAAMRAPALKSSAVEKINSSTNGGFHAM